MVAEWEHQPGIIFDGTTSRKSADGAEAPNGGHLRDSQWKSTTYIGFAPEPTPGKRERAHWLHGGAISYGTGWEEKSTPPPRRGVAPVGVTDVDKTSAMPAIGFPCRFPTSTGTIRPAGRGALRQSLQRGMRHYKCRHCRPARSQAGISPGAPTTTGLVGELNAVSTEGAEARGDLVAGDSPSRLH